MGHQWAKIAYLVHKGIFLKRQWFIPNYCPLSCCKVWKKSLDLILRYKLAQLWATIGPKLPIWPKRGNFRKFRFHYFYVLIVLYHAAMFEKFLRAYSEIKAWAILGHNQGHVQRFLGDTIFWNDNFSLLTLWLPAGKKITSF